MLSARDWLARAHYGACDDEPVSPGGCESGSWGEFRLPRTAYDRTWPAIVQACLDACAGCARCEYVQVSPVWRDCVWKHACDVDALQQITSGHLSGRARRATTTSTPNSSAAAAAPAVWVDVPGDEVPRPGVHTW